MDALKGIAASAVSSFFFALLLVYLFRFPIPFGGYIGPFSDISSYNVNVIEVLGMVLMAWVFYGIFGGFIILPILGAITGIVVGRKYLTLENKNRMIILWVSAVTFVPVFMLSILDYIIGPW